MRNKRSSDFTATPEKYPQKRFNPKPCKWCGIEFKPIAPSHLHCSDNCADKSVEQNYFIKNYGISRNDVYALLEAQDYKCAICNGEGFRMSEHQVNKLVLDHCHKFGDVRGMLCHNCNRGLGLFQDSPDHLRSAIKYLEGATTSRKTYIQADGSARLDSNIDDEIVCSALKDAAVVSPRVEISDLN